MGSLLGNIVALLLWSYISYFRVILVVEILDSHKWGRAFVQRRNWLGVTSREEYELCNDDRATLRCETTSASFGGLFNHPTLEIIRRNGDQTHPVCGTSMFFAFQNRHSCPVDDWIDRMNAFLVTGERGKIELVYRNPFTTGILVVLGSAALMQLILILKLF